MDRATLKTLDVASAITGEAHNPPFLLPSRQIEDAVVVAEIQSVIEPTPEWDFDRLVRYCAGRFHRGVRNHAVETVLASKSPKGRRPVHALSFEQRVLYRALVEGLGDELEPPNRSDEAWTNFQQGPLGDPELKYLVRTDVVGCYQFIDHHLLADEVIAQTGDASITDEVASFLRDVLGSSRGLPQNLGPSHTLAECYLDKIERALLRDGIPTWRFSDDFILASESWGGINRALERLTEEIRASGLSINEEKTRFFGRAKYQGWVNAPLERLQTAGAADLIAVLEDYDPDEPPDDEDRQVALHGSEGVALELLSRCLASHDRDVLHDRLDVATNRKIARGALRLLTITRSSQGLLFARDLLRFEPQLTPAVAKYLARVGQEQPDLVSELMTTFVSEPDLYLSTWQSMWLTEPLVGGSVSQSEPLIAWLTNLLGNSLSLARGRAALSLAWADLIEPAEISQLYTTAPLAARPDFVAAMAIRCSDAQAREVRALAKDSPFNAIVAATSLRH